MNIFKILANGDGRINEANISAFLGYLLDPYEDHGLGFEFLNRFLDCYFAEIEDFNCKEYDYEILYEQAFRDEDKEIKKKEIVDVVILCFKSNRGNFKELIAKTITQSERELKYIFLLENKVTSHARKENQILAQFENTIKSLDIDESKVVSFYITPDEKGYEDEFKKFTQSTLKHHFIWKKKESEIKDDLFNMLLDLIKDESEGKIEAINIYTKHTLISFIKFIENNFKSQIIEKKEDAEGKYKRDISENIQGYLDKYSDNLNHEANGIVKEFTKFILSEFKMLKVRHSKTHPVSILTNQNSGKIFGCNRYGKSLNYHIVIKRENHPEIYRKLISYLLDKNLEYQIADWGILLRENLNINDLKLLFKNFYLIINERGK